MRFDGYADDGARLRMRQLIHLGSEARIIGGVLNQQGLAVLSHPTGHTLAQLQANIPELFRAGADGNLEIQLLRVLIQHQQRPGIRLEQIAYFFHDGLKNLLQVEGREKRLPHLVKEREAFDLTSQF